MKSPRSERVPRADPTSLIPEGARFEYALLQRDAERWYALTNASPRKRRMAEFEVCMRGLRFVTTMEKVVRRSSRVSRPRARGSK